MKSTTKKSVYSKATRSKKHKKIKPVDPFYTNKGRPASSIGANVQTSSSLASNAPPKNPDHQEIPKSLTNLQIAASKYHDMSKKQLKNKFKKKGALKGWAFNERPEVDQKGMTRPIKEVPQFIRMKKESKRDFLKRVDKETKRVLQRSKFEQEYNVTVKKGEDGETKVKPMSDIDIIGVTEMDTAENTSQKNLELSKSKISAKQNQEKSKLSSKQRHNQKLSEKRKARKLAKLQKKATDFDHLQDIVGFGEVATRPPQFQNQPRKSNQKLQAGNRKLLLTPLVSNATDKTCRPTQTTSHRKPGKSVKSKALSLGERYHLEAEREKIVEHYRQLKTKKFKSTSL